MLGYQTVMIEISKNYHQKEFREDIKKFMRLCATGDKDSTQITFLFLDTQIVVEGFLEDINNLLNSGEVPNLWPHDEKKQVINENREYNAKKNRAPVDDTIFRTFVERVRSSMHVVLCMSPVGDALRIRCRKFPSLVDCCGLNWFSAWPEQALFSVAQKILKDEPTFPRCKALDQELLIENLSKIS